MRNRTNDLRGHCNRNEDWDVNSPVRTEKRGRGRPPSIPSLGGAAVERISGSAGASRSQAAKARTSEKNADE